MSGKYIRGQFFPSKRATGIDKPGRAPQPHTIVLAEEDGFPPGIAVYYDPYATGVKLRMRRFNRTDVGEGGSGREGDKKVTGALGIMRYIQNNWPNWGPENHPEAPEELRYYGHPGWYQAAAYPYVDLSDDEKMLRAIDVAHRHISLRKDIESGVATDGSRTFTTPGASSSSESYEDVPIQSSPESTGYPGSIGSILGSPSSVVSNYSIGSPINPPEYYEYDPLGLNESRVGTPEQSVFSPPQQSFQVPPGSVMIDLTGEDEPAGGLRRSNRLIHNRLRYRGGL